MQKRIVKNDFGIDAKTGRIPVLRGHLHFLTMLQPLMGSGDGVNTQ